MAATAEFYQWKSMGEPYALIQPAKDHQANIRRHGFVVYDYPDDSHLESSNPQDHTPFSYTKWPRGGHQVDGKGRAIDVMPKSSSAMDRKELADMARQIIRDKDNNVDGTQAIKYMNWTDENGVCRNENWKSGMRVTTSSTDKGHNHISYRDDMDTRSAAGYDPVARMTGGDDMNADQAQMLAQIHAIVRGGRWLWDTDRAGFIAAGGDPKVWDYGGGMGVNEESRLLKALPGAMTKLGEQLTLVLQKLEEIDAASGGLSEEDSALLQATMDAVRELNSRLVAAGGEPT